MGDPWANLVALVLGAIVVGAVAQRQKGRVGAGWGVITFVLGIGIWAFFEFAMGTSPRLTLALARMAQNNYGQFAIINAAVVSVPATVLMLVIVATLPKRAKPAAPAQAAEEARCPCPFCAEKILPAAKVCPHCRNDLPENWSRPETTG